MGRQMRDGHRCSEGELLLVTQVGPEQLDLDCVLEDGAGGCQPTTLAVQLSENRALALFEQSLLAQWVEDGRFVEARLAGHGGPTWVVLTAGESALVLTVRTPARP